MKLIWIMVAVLLVAGCAPSPEEIAGKAKAAAWRAQEDAAKSTCRAAYIALSKAPSTVIVDNLSYAAETENGLVVAVGITDANTSYSGLCYTDQAGRNPRLTLK